MIIIVYAVLLFFALLFTFLGYYSDSPATAFVGYGFLFILGVSLLNGSIEYKDGYTETVSGNVTTVEDNYATYDNWSIGFYLAVASFIGAASTFWQWRYPKTE